MILNYRPTTFLESYTRMIECFIYGICCKYVANRTLSL